MSEETAQVLQSDPADRATFPYDGFISYRHTPTQMLIVSAIQAALHKFAKPFWKLRALHLYRDESNLSVRPDLWGAIVEALDRSRYLLLVASPESVESKWVKRETSHWLERRGDRNLIILLTDGEIAWDDAAQQFDPSRTTAIPCPLLTYQKTEPLYVDLRWAGEPDALLSMSNPRFADAVATIAAELHGKPKEELAGIDVLEHRRLGRVRNAGVSVISLLAVGMAFAAYYSYEERRRAEDGLLTTQNLFSELGDLVAETVRPIARLDEVDSMLNQAEKVIAVQRSDPRMALPYAGVLLTRAEIKSEAGLVDEMRALAKRATHVLEHSDKSIPEVQNLLGRADGLVGLSYVGTAAGQDTAREYYGKALARLEPLENRFDQTTSAEKNDWRWLRSLANVQADMGDLLLNQFAEVENARQYYQRSFDTWTKLKRLRPDDPEVAYQLSWAENKIGDVLQARGEDELALGAYKSAETALKPAAARLSVDQRRMTSLAISQNNVGLIRRSLGQYEQAISAFKEAAGNIDALLSYDQNQNSWLSDKAWTCDSIGETRVRWARAKGDASLLQGARDELKTGRDIRTRLATITDKPRWKIEAAISEANMLAYEGTEKELARNCGDAAALFDRAAQKNPTRTINARDERSDELVLRSAEFREWAGFAYRNAGNNMQAENEVREALKTLNEEPPKFPAGRKAFATIKQRLEQELQGSAPYKPSACLP